MVNSENLMERSPVPMAELEGPDHVMRYVNPAFCRLLGKSQAALTGKPFVETMQEKNGCLVLLDRVYRTGEPEIHTEAGDREPDSPSCSYAIWPVLDAAQRPVSVIMQVTETTRSQQEMSAMNEALLLSSVRQHELTEAAEQLSDQLGEEIVEHKRTEDALRVAEEHFRYSIAHAPIPVIMQAEDGEVLEISKTWAELTGYTREEMKTLEAWLHRAYGPGADAVREHVRDLFSGKSSIEPTEFEIETRSGELRHWIFSAWPVGTLLDGRRYLVGTALDVTDRKQAEEALRRSEKNYRTLFDSIDVGFCTIEVLFNQDNQPVDYRFLEVNPAFRRQTGIENAAGKRMREIAPQHEQHWFEIYGRIALTGEPRRFQNRAKELDRFYDVYAFRIGKAHERKVAILFNDISERERTEEALRASEERFRAIFNQSTGGVAQTDLSGRLVLVNDRYCEITGRSREELLQLRMHDITHPEDLPQNAENFRALAEGRGDNFVIEKRYLRPDGSLVWVHNDVSAIRDAKGDVGHIAAAVFDITERKQAEEELIATRNQLATELSALARLHDLNTRMLATESLEPLLEEVLEVVMELQGAEFGSIQLLNRTTGALEIVAARGFKQALFDHFAKSQGAGSACGRAWQARERVIIEDVTKDSAYQKHRKAAAAAGYRAVVCTPLSDRSGETVGVLNIHFRNPHRPSERDLRLTDLYATQAAETVSLKLAERALRESEERFRLLVEGTPDYAMFLIDPVNTIVYWSGGAERVFGWSAKEAVGQNGNLIFTPEDRTRKQEEKELAIVLRDGHAPDRRWHMRKDGTRIWVDGIMRRLDDEDGTLRGFAKIARNATEQRAAEQELRRSHAHLGRRVRERTAKLTQTNRQLQAEMKRRAQLEQEVILISEREKRRIGQDLHDILCQELAATALFLQSAAQRIGKKAPSGTKALTEAARTVNHNVGLARDLARGLHPVELSASGLANALRELAFRTSQFPAAACRFDYPRQVRIGDEGVALNLYRIAQEAITNAVKNGKATQITIKFMRKRRDLILTVHDNGKGFAVAKPAHGMGIHIMKYRADVIGARLTIESSEGHGTTVTCILPGE